jgi:DNA-binding IclR family transcriptional regulator
LGKRTSSPQGVEAAPGEADPGFATTLAHGLQVLSAFRAGDASLSNGELAVRTGLSRPTVSRLVHTLLTLGYLRRDANGRYMLASGVLAIAYPMLASLKIRQVARPLMREFATLAGGTVSIAMPNGLNFIYVETVRTTNAAAHVPEVGFMADLAPTAVGRALLSLYSDAEFDSYRHEMATTRPAEWAVLGERVRRGITDCRTQGYCVSLGEWRPEIYGVAAPLFRTPDGDCLAINCGIPSFRFTRSDVERDCGPQMLGLAQSVRALMAQSGL